VNTVFARVGLEWVGAAKLEAYARRFRFREPFGTHIPIGMGTISLSPDPWSIAEVASGFNRVVRLSPLHGAAIASTIVNSGVMMEPFLVDSFLFSGDGSEFKMASRSLGSAISSQTAQAMREMMEETVRTGTPARSFRHYRRKMFSPLAIGGKTGSLSSELPQGKCDWFVGYAMSPMRNLAYAVLTVNRDLWRVKSATVAERVVYEFFERPMRPISLKK
jgi:cell division protein FtsI/penicillin-binding protein 2